MIASAEPAAQAKGEVGLAIGLRRGLATYSGFK
jgi:hypothetical protein